MLKDFVDKQLEAVLTDMSFDVMKTGMLYSESIISLLCDRLDSCPSVQPIVVCDPVCVSSSGHSLLQPEALSVYKQRLFVRSYLITPNIPEAALLLNHPECALKSVPDMRHAAMALLSQFGCRYVLLKGGHLAQNGAQDDRDDRNNGDGRDDRDDKSPGTEYEGVCVDILCTLKTSVEDAEHDVAFTKLLGDDLDPRTSTTLSSVSPTGMKDMTITRSVIADGGKEFTIFEFISAQIPHSKNTHGTGCSLASAIASYLAKGYNVVEAVARGKARVHGLIKGSTHYNVGMGDHRPLNFSLSK
jgi:hydroxymethylpyrimidine/phosphomethylpyrimidine kinase